jgi:outer membrane protein TolC
MLYRRGLRDIAQSSHDNNALLLESVEKRFNAGDAAASDVATVRFDADATLQQLQLAEANYQSAVRDLLRQMGMPATSTYEFVGDIQSIRWRLPANHCLQETAESLALELATEKQFLEEAWIRDCAAARPDVLAARANIAVARANFRLASASRVPDVNVGPYYQQNPDGLTHVGFRADMNLPVIDTGRPLQSQRSAELNQQSVTWNQLLRRAELEGLAAYERYKVAYQALEESSQNLFVMPQELQSLERQFREGEVDVVRAIQARTSILQKQRAYLDLLNEAAQSAATVVGAMGIPIEELIHE